RVQGVTLRTSFIVGFPGETDEMLQELVDFVRETEFERMGVFIYSPEEGTQAFLMESNVPREVAEERYRILMEVQQGISYKLNKALISRTLPVLIDGFDKDRNMYYGRSEGDGIEIDHTVWVKGIGRVGEIVPVRITENSYYDLIGTVAEN
ncbi:30S ribosomal protein S12 methylthiotransferase RimO, partial [bacterium]|nr:30S ribosomal protein S12 methylthiotransferase RimO [bacterium]